MQAGARPPACAGYRVALHYSHDQELPARSLESSFHRQQAGSSQPRAQVECSTHGPQQSKSAADIAVPAELAFTRGSLKGLVDSGERQLRLTFRFEGETQFWSIIRLPLGVQHAANVQSGASGACAARVAWRDAVSEAAAKLHVSRVTLSRILNGKAGISAEMCCASPMPLEPARHFGLICKPSTTFGRRAASVGQDRAVQEGRVIRASDVTE